MSSGGFGSLVGTLTGNPDTDQILLQMAQQAQQQQAQMAQRTQAAQQGATQAAQDYSQAAAAPPPTLDPLSQLLTTLGGSAASILSGNPSYQQNAQQDVRQSKSQLLKARAENLQGLQDIAKQKAEEAQKAGDLETAQKSRQDYERLAKQLEVVQSNHKIQASNESQARSFAQQSKLQSQRDSAAEQRQAQREKASTAEATDFADYVNSDRAVPFIDISKIPSIKTRQAAVDYARKNKIGVVNDRENSALALVDEAKANISGIQDRVLQHLPINAKDRLIRGPLNVAASVSQQNPDLAAYPAYRTAAINAIQAIAGLGKGLRINQAEINAALKYDIPTITDTQDAARTKLQILGEMLDHVERSALGRPPTQGEINRVIAARPDRAVKGKAPAGSIGSGSAPGAKQGALKAATAKNRDEFVRMLKANPGLDADPEIIGAARQAGWIK